MSTYKDYIANWYRFMQISMTAFSWLSLMTTQGSKQAWLRL